MGFVSPISQKALWRGLVLPSQNGCITLFPDLSVVDELRSFAYSFRRGGEKNR